MILLFAFSIDQDTKEATFAGNIEPQVALQILQSIVIVEAVKQARQNEVKVEGGTE